MKQIHGIRDLAINGAKPAFDVPLHVGRPNMGSREKFVQYVDEIFERRWLTNNGPLVKELEGKIADLHGVKHCVAMCNGTVALEIAIRALNLKGEVIVPSYTFIATAHALHWQAIRPVFADIDPATHCLDPAAVRRKITAKTTGIIGVHLWGNVARVDELKQIANEHGLKLMFDAAHAFGCMHQGRSVGSFGECEVLSFHATKFFNTFEGGAVLTNNDQLAETMQLMRNFGFAGFDDVIYPGTNGKMPEISAAMGLVNLESIDQVIQTNRQNYQLYAKELAGLPGIRVLSFDKQERNNYQYVVLVVSEECSVSRDSLVEALQAENILARKYFWPGCHNMLPYRISDPDAYVSLPVTEKIAKQVVVLPTGTSLDQHMIETVCAVIKMFVLDGKIR